MAPPVIPPSSLACDAWDAFCAVAARGYTEFVRVAGRRLSDRGGPDPSCVGRLGCDGSYAAEARAPFTFGDLAEAARIIEHYATELHFIGSPDEARVRALAQRLGDASEADPNP